VDGGVDETGEVAFNGVKWWSSKAAQWHGLAVVLAAMRDRWERRRRRPPSLKKNESVCWSGWFGLPKWAGSGGFGPLTDSPFFLFPFFFFFHFLSCFLTCIPNLF
jgi:hypothetical protein